MTERVQGEKVRLEEIVKGANMMTLSVSSSMSQGRTLTSTESDVAKGAIKGIEELRGKKELLMKYLSKLTTSLCPNMANLCGHSYDLVACKCNNGNCSVYDINCSCYF